MNLRFEGDLSLWQGALLAAVVATLVWSVYRREVGGRGERVAWLLPLVRTGAVVLIVLMLTGPVVERRVEVGELSRVLVFVDESQSMGLLDEGMSPERKLLNAHRMGWLPEGSFDLTAHHVARRLRDARPFAAAAGEVREALEAVEDKAGPAPPVLVSRLDRASAAFSRLFEEARAALPEAGTGAGGGADEGAAGAGPGAPRVDLHAVAADFERELVDVAARLSDRGGPRGRRRGDDEEKRDSAAAQLGRARDLVALAAAAEAWEQRLAGAFSRQAEAVIERGEPAVVKALERLDKLSRWRRAESALLEGDSALVKTLGQRHHVELLTTSGPPGADADPKRLWWPQETLEPPAALDPELPSGPATDLVAGLEARVGQKTEGERLAVVLFSDGQHNRAAGEGGSPLRAAKVFGSLGVPVFTVGVGADTPPKDLAVLAVQAPESVFADDRVKGELLVKDHLPPGQQMIARITLDGEVLWEKHLSTTGEGRRTLAFDFRVKGAVEDRLARSPAEMEVLSMPLTMVVELEPLEGEVREDNNRSDLHVRAVTRRRRALILDGRNRWETRYVRNLFDRDEQWEVNPVICGHDGDGRPVLPRGGGRGGFPADKKTLFSYDLLILGEVSRAAFQPAEIAWLGEFVANRGGGVVLIDGRRGKLRGYAGTAVEELLPVAWTSPPGEHGRGPRPARLERTTRGREIAALGLEGGAGGVGETTWADLPPPRWSAPVTALPGAEVLAEVVRPDGQGRAPALVLRRYGAGTVLYAAFDEAWRWRYEVADRFFQRYWNQVANFVMERPFAVNDTHVSIDTGGFTYGRGEPAQIRVRLRDKDGKPVVEADAEAVLYRGGETVSTVPLSGDRNAGGVFRGTTDALGSGIYEVGVRATGFTESELSARAEFVVLGDPSGEMNVLFCDEELLRQVAYLSGGHYLREEDLASLPDRLAPFTDGRIEDRETLLWRSWFLFIPLVGLFTAEWVIRKKAGLM